MDAHKPLSLIGEYAGRIIKKKARQLIGKAGFNQSDIEDIEQELYLHVLESIPNFREDMSSGHTYIYKVVDKRANNIIRSRVREARDYRREEFSLNEDVRNADDSVSERWATLDRLKGRINKSRLNPNDQRDLHIDILDIAKRLPESLRETLFFLMSGTITEFALQIGIPRTTAGDRLKKLRHVFRESGLEKYLE